MMRRWKKGIGIILFMSVGLLALSWVVMTLWNFAVVAAMQVEPLNYWQAMALLVLMRILVGGVRMGPRGRGPGPGKWGRWRKKWEAMSDEDRAKWKQEWKNRCPPGDS